MTQTLPRLISHKLCPYVQRARIVIAEKRIPHEMIFIKLNDPPVWFRQFSPLGKVPLLEVGHTVLFESAVICEYLEETSPGHLHPTDPLDRARNRSWIEFASNLLGGIAAFYRAPEQDALEQQRRLLRERFARLEEELGDGPWFNGEAFSMVDAAFGPVFRYFDTIERYGDFDLFTATPRVLDWRARLADRPSIASAVVADYPERLHQFILNLDSELSEFAKYWEDNSGRVQARNA